MLCSAPHLRRDALLIRGLLLHMGPGSAEQRNGRCTASGHDILFIFENGYSSINVAASAMRAREVR